MSKLKLIAGLLIAFMFLFKDEIGAVLFITSLVALGLGAAFAVSLGGLL